MRERLVARGVVFDRGDCSSSFSVSKLQLHRQMAIPQWTVPVMSCMAARNGLHDVHQHWLKGWPQAN